MLRHLLVGSCAAALLSASPAFADLIINVPDVPEFTITDPIISDEDVFINVLPGTTLVIDTRIEAQNLTIVGGALVDLGSAEIIVGGTTTIAAGGPIFPPDLEPQTGSPELDGNAPDIILSRAARGGGRDTITVASAGNVTVAASVAQGNDFVTKFDIFETDEVSLGNVTITSAAPITVNGITIEDAAAPANATTPTDLAEAEAPIAILQTTAGDIAVVLDASSLTPLEADLGGAGLSSELYRASDFAGKLFSCPQSAPDRRFDEGTCAYATGGVDRLESDNGASEFDDTTWSFTIGAQAEVAENIFVGGALAYESSQTDTAATDRETQRGRAGLVVKYDDGAISAGLALSAGYGAIDTSRAVVSGTTSGETDATTLEARARVAYGLRFGELAVEPSIATSVLYVEEDGYTETGTALANRQVSATDVTTAGLHAGLSFGTDFVAGPYQIRIRPELNLGLDWFADPDVSVSATGATGRALFQNVDADHLTGTVSAGITVFAADDVALRLRYGGRFGESTTGHGGEVKLTLGF
ncbi:MAG: autotransporter domain-containing protein [Pseudomonadota bacterium]